VLDRDTHADQMVREHGMTRAQWIILARLERQPDLSQNELAALAEVAPITVARLVDRLEALGLVNVWDNAAMESFFSSLKTERTWAAAGSKDTELGVKMEPEVGHGATEIYPRVQA
jgi:DNA-binding transcriptional regulator LsrR (DeoR family)